MIDKFVNKVNLPVISEGEPIATIEGWKEGGKYFWHLIDPVMRPPKVIIPKTSINPTSTRSRWEMVKILYDELEIDGLTKEEIRIYVDELCKRLLELDDDGAANGQRESAGILIRLALDECIFFRDEHGTAFAAIKLNDGGSAAVMQVRGRDFKVYLARLLWEHEGKAASSEAVSSAITTLEAIACFEGEQRKLNLRVAWGDGGAIFYDLGRPDWQLVKIDREGWRYVEHSEPVFKRYPHMLPQVEPDPEAQPENFRELIKHIRVANGDEILLLCHVASFMIPDIPHPIPVVFGAQGSGKTTAFEMIRRIVDPSSLEVLTFPRDSRELIQKLAHNYVALFDNVSRLNQEQSDALCRAVTGTAQSKRALYTDDDDVYYKFIRCVGTNGINISGLEPDFLDRAILYELERIPITERREKREIMEAFARDLPSIVGGLFSTISRALGIVEKVREELKGKLPRMADFTVWGEAISRALGYEALEFYNAYMEKLRRQNKEVLEADVIGDLLIKFMENRESWEGTPTELLKELTKLAEEYGLDSVKGFPKAPHALTRRLNRLKPNLAEEGIAMERYETGGGKRNRRIIRIERREGTGKGVTCVTALPTGTGGSNAISNAIEADDDSVTKALPDSPGRSNGSNACNAISRTPPPEHLSSKMSQADLAKRVSEALQELHRLYGNHGISASEIAAYLGFCSEFERIEALLEEWVQDGIVWKPEPKERRYVWIGR